MDFQSLQNDLKDWLKEKARAAAGAVQAAGNGVQRVENYLGIKPQGPTPNPIRDPKGFAKDVLITKPVRSVKNMVNPVLEGLNIVSSYPAGGMVKVLSEVKKGTYQAPKTGVKILGRDAGEFINPSIVGAVRGIKNKQTLFEEVPKAANVKNPVGAFALGLGAELAVPIPGGGKVKAGEKLLQKGRDYFNADKLSQILGGALKMNPEAAANKPNRLVGERMSFKEAMTGLANNGQYLKGRIQIGINDAKQLVLEDGTHLLEAYRQLGKQIPLDKIQFNSDAAKKVFGRLLKKNGDIIETITRKVAPVDQRIDRALEQAKLTEKKVRQGFTKIINGAKSQDDAALGIRDFVKKIAESGDEKLKDMGVASINAQLARFQAFKGNKKAEKLFQALEDGFNELKNVPFGAEGMFNRVAAPRDQKEYESFSELVNQVDPARIIAFPRIASVVDQLKDLSSLRPGWSDFERNFEKVFGKGSENFKVVKQEVLDPFLIGKANFVDEVYKLTDDLENTIVKGLGIDPGSKLSSLVQQFGEKRMSLTELQATAPKDWQRVVEADKWFRTMYDTILDGVNAARAKIYPNNPDKIIPKRDDYYRHFQELSDTFAGLKNILTGPNNIAPSLAGVSDFTKPKSRWASFMQARTGDSTKLDAVGGFVDYIKAALYAKHVDPTIDNFLGLAQDMRQVTEKGDTKLNNFIEYLSDFSGRLAGKTNSLDRGVQKNIPGGRTTMKAINWLNQKFRVNAILGNISSAVNQTLSLPIGIADAGPVNAAKGAAEALGNIFQEGASLQSKFLKERYLDSAFDRFDVGMVESAKKGAKWMLQSLEELSTRFIWNAQYQRALSEGAENAVDLADSLTRKVVAGRGIGEVPLIQDSKIFQLALPFQVEVANQWLVMKDWVDAKQFGKFVTFAIGSHVLNSALQSVTGFRPGYDPIASLAEGIQNTMNDKDEAGGLYPFLGQTLSNIPGGGYVARTLVNPDDSTKIFGKNNDPLRFDRYGTGIPLASAFQPVKDVVSNWVSGDGVAPSDVVKVIETFALPFGGGQVKKTLGGASMLASGGQYDKEGGLQFPTDPDFLDKAKSLVFGPYANDNARLYFKEELKTLTPKETAAWKQAVDGGADPTQKWMEIQQGKISRGLREKVQDVMKDPDIKPEDKPDKVNQIKAEYDRLMRMLQNYQP